MKDVAAINPLRNEETGNGLLVGLYSKVNFIDDKTAAACYLNPEDVCGKGCINETFRVLRDNELRQLGEYRTKRLVMEAWHRFGYDN